MFGDVQIDNKGEALVPQLPTFNITANNRVNVRSGPGTSNSRVASLSRGQTVVADGRNEGNDWLRIQLEGGQTGWVSAGFVTADGDFSTLSVVEVSTNQAAQYGAMQAFYLRTGIADAPCQQAPNSGLLVQSPQGAAHVTLEVNEVTIQLGSTIYLEACACHGLDLFVVEGGALVTAQGVSRYVPAGASVHVPTDDNNLASGPPEDLASYDASQVQALPIDLLKDAIQIAVPLTDAELVAAQNPTPIDGNYTALLTISGGADCYYANGSSTTTANNNTSFVFSDDRATLTTTAHLDNGMTSETVWKRAVSGVYTYSAPQRSWKMTILSATAFIMEQQTSGGCYGIGTYTRVETASSAAPSSPSSPSAPGG